MRLKQITRTTWRTAWRAGSPAERPTAWNRLAGQLLVNQGGSSVLHARNDARAADAEKGVGQGRSGRDRRPRQDNAAKDVRETDQLNAIGSFDAIIHNAAVGFQNREASPATVPHVRQPLPSYILTALIGRTRGAYSQFRHNRAHKKIADQLPLAQAGRATSRQPPKSRATKHDVWLSSGVAPLGRYTPEDDEARIDSEAGMGGAGAPDDIARKKLSGASRRSRVKNSEPGAARAG